MGFCSHLSNMRLQQPKLKSTLNWNSSQQSKKKQNNNNLVSAAAKENHLLILKLSQT